MSLSRAGTITQSGLKAVSAEASVVARNIAGAREASHFSRRIANVTATLNGSAVISVTRLSNQAVFANVLASAASAAAQSAMFSGLETLNRTIGSLADSLEAPSPAGALSKFTNALQSYSASPSDSNVAGSVIAAAKTLATTLNDATNTIQSARAQADLDMTASVKTINSLLIQFQALNAQVVQGSAAGSDVADAQDRRDEILEQLAQEIGISPVRGTNNDVSIYTDSGVTLFQGGLARDVTFAPTDTFTAAIGGNQVFANGVPITGSSSAMPVQAGKLAGLANFRDRIATTYQAQLDNVAGALIDSFAESDQIGPGPDLPGLFTTPGATSLPAARTGLAGLITINAAADPSQGGTAHLLRDGGISNPGYVYNTSGDASFNGRIVELIGKLSAPQTFGSGTSLTTNASLSSYVSASVSWLEGQRSSVLAERRYQDALLSTATAALSNATGVNLDQEMSKMLDLERSYAASAKLMSAIDTMFQHLLSAI